MGNKPKQFLNCFNSPFYLPYLLVFFEFLINVTLIFLDFHTENLQVIITNFITT